MRETMLQERDPGWFFFLSVVREVETVKARPCWNMDGPAIKNSPGAPTPGE